MSAQPSDALSDLADSVSPIGVQKYREALRAMGVAESPDVACLANKLGLPDQPHATSTYASSAGADRWWLASLVFGPLVLAAALTGLAVLSDDNNVLFLLPPVIALLSLMVSRTFEQRQANG